MVSKIRLALLDPGRIPLIIGSALTASSNFFINYITIQAGPLPTSASGETRGEPTILLLAVRIHATSSLAATRPAVCLLATC